MDKNIEFAISVIEYVTEEILLDDYWKKVDNNVYYSKIICCLCTLNEVFADEVDDAVFTTEVGQESVRIEDSIYGEMVITKNDNGEIRVSLIAERSQIILPESNEEKSSMDDGSVVKRP